MKAHSRTDRKNPLVSELAGHDLGEAILFGITSESGGECAIPDFFEFLVAEFGKHGVVALLADNTAKDPEIFRYIRENYNRRNLPVNVILSPNLDDPPLVFPEILSQDAVIKGSRPMAGKKARAEAAKTASNDS